MHDGWDGEWNKKNKTTKIAQSLKKTTTTTKKKEQEKNKNRKSGGNS